MNKEEAKYLIGLQYTKIIEGSNIFNYGGKDYTFVEIDKQLSGLQFARQVSVISNLDTVKFKDANDVYVIPNVEFDMLLATIILSGNTLWEKKISKYELLELATTSEEIESIVNSDW
jgi:hypothetical protein